MYTLLEEPTLINTYFAEYIDLLHRYADTKRSAVLATYYKINVEKSRYDEALKASELVYDNNIVFDVYHLTPLIYVSPQTNTLTLADLGTVLATTPVTIDIWTIDEPRVNDLVIFEPSNDRREIFRVTNVKTIMGQTFHELDLDYAPITDMSRLSIDNIFVYYLPTGRYIPVDKYNRIADLTENILSLEPKLTFDTNREVFYTNDGILWYSNCIFYQASAKYNMLAGVRVPFGVLDTNVTYDTALERYKQGFELVEVDGTTEEVPRATLLESSDLLQLTDYVVEWLELHEG